jgi:hypothetical protein
MAKRFQSLINGGMRLIQFQFIPSLLPNQKVKKKIQPVKAPSVSEYTKSGDKINPTEKAMDRIVRLIRVTRGKIPATLYY